VLGVLLPKAYITVHDPHDVCRSRAFGGFQLFLFGREMSIYAYIGLFVLSG